MNMDQLRAELLRLSKLTIDRANSLAPEFYTNSDWLSLERSVIFRHDWICVGRSDELLRSGDYLTAAIDGAPFVVVRLETGKLTAFSTVCRHRMALIVQGAGNARGFTCPYHGWTYDLAGNLISAPRMPKDFDRSRDCLPAVATEEWNGFVYATLCAEADPLKSRLEDLTRELTPYHLERMRTLRRELDVLLSILIFLVENFLEPYHLNATHPATLAKFAPPEGVTVLPRRSGYQFHAHRMSEDSAPIPLDPRIGIPNLEISEEGKRTAYIGGVFPSHLLAVTWDSVFWLALQPRGVDEVILDWGVAGPLRIPDGETLPPDHPNLLYVRMADLLNSEDRVRVEAVQHGATSGYGRQNRLHPHEAPILGFIAYLQERLGE